MTTRLEGIVRPFAKSTVFTARSLPPVQPVVTPPADVTATWGDAISLHMKPNGLSKWYISVELTEDSRVTHTERVTNPDDEAQYVDVEVLDALHLKDSNGQIHKWTFNNP